MEYIRMGKHHIRIEARGRAVLSRVFLDGEEMKGVLAVRVEIDTRALDKVPLVTLTLIPSELIVEGDPDVEIEQQTADTTP